MEGKFQEKNQSKWEILKNIVEFDLICSMYYNIRQ
jgi:hypothetical protein